MSARKIIIHFVNPPIPIRDYDWAAYRDGYEPGEPHGEGRTEQAAINDLLEKEDSGLLSRDDQKAQARRCSCKGTDDYCGCQNVPDAVTRAERLAAAVEAASARAEGEGV